MTLSVPVCCLASLEAFLCSSPASDWRVSPQARLPRKGTQGRTFLAYHSLIPSQSNSYSGSSPHLLQLSHTPPHPIQDALLHPRHPRHHCISRPWLSYANLSNIQVQALLVLRTDLLCAHASLHSPRLPLCTAECLRLRQLSSPASSAGITSLQAVPRATAFLAAYALRLHRSQR